METNYLLIDDYMNVPFVETFFASIDILRQSCFLIVHKSKDKRKILTDHERKISRKVQRKKMHG